MPFFPTGQPRWKAMSSRASSRPPRKRVAIERIKEHGSHPVEDRRAPGRGLKTRHLAQAAKGDLLTFTTEMSALLSAGLPLDRSLNILSDIIGEQGDEEYRSIHPQIDQGGSVIFGCAPEATRRLSRGFTSTWYGRVKRGGARRGP